jgi:hypothetical protein
MSNECLDETGMAYLPLGHINLIWTAHEPTFFGSRRCNAFSTSTNAQHTRIFSSFLFESPEGILYFLCIEYNRSFYEVEKCYGLQARLQGVTDRA